MSDSNRDLVLRAIGELDQTYAMLNQELAGCQDLCSAVATLLERVRRNEKTIVDTLARWDRMREQLQGMVDAEDDAADWWKR